MGLVQIARCQFFVVVGTNNNCGVEIRPSEDEKFTAMDSPTLVGDSEGRFKRHLRKASAL